MIKKLREMKNLMQIIQRDNKCPYKHQKLSIHAANREVKILFQSLQRYIEVKLIYRVTPFTELRTLNTVMQQNLTM